MNWYIFTSGAFLLALGVLEFLFIMGLYRVCTGLRCDLNSLAAQVESLEKDYVNHVWKPIGYLGTHGPQNVTEMVKNILKEK